MQRPRVGIRRTATEYYVGLDVSVKTTAICIVDGKGEVVREAALVTEPATLAEFLRRTGFDIVRVGHEAGPMSAWLYEGLEAAGLPVVCVEARHMKSALSAMVNKTDRNDARGIAQMMRALDRAYESCRGEARRLLASRSGPANARPPVG